MDSFDLQLCCDARRGSEVPNPVRIDRALCEYMERANEKLSLSISQTCSPLLFPIRLLC
jgi:hypothetical protein